MRRVEGFGCLRPPRYDKDEGAQGADPGCSSQQMNNVADQMDHPRWSLGGSTVA